MPETQSREKMDTLRALGAELVLVPAAPYSNPNHFVHTSRRIAEETPGALWADQFDNTANRRSEEHTSELQSLMRISYAVFCLKKKKKTQLHEIKNKDKDTSTLTINTNKTEYHLKSKTI